MRAAVILSCLLLSACSGFPSFSPYKIDVQQGNYVSQEMAAKLHPGMTKSQVRFVLGTPLINDVFHADRWDYFYSYQKDGKVVEQRHITVLFEKDLLKRVEGDVTPAAADKPSN
jgi:outer membrane protein assembly factor BamE